MDELSWRGDGGMELWVLVVWDAVASVYFCAEGVVGLLEAIRLLVCR